MNSLREKQRKAFRSRKFPWDMFLAAYDENSFPMRIGQWWLVECRPVHKSGWRRLKFERHKPPNATRGRYSLVLVWNGKRLSDGSESRDLERYPAFREPLLAALREHDSLERRKYRIDICRPIKSDHEGLW